MKDLNDIALPSELHYAESHEWIAAAAPFRIGVTDFAQDALGDITFVELPDAGKTFAKGEEFGSLESIKSVSAVYLPAAGKIIAVNPLLADDPGLVNRDPYGDGWLVEIEPSDPAASSALLPADRYLAHLKEQA